MTITIFLPRLESQIKKKCVTHDSRSESVKLLHAKPIRNWNPFDRPFPSFTVNFVFRIRRIAFRLSIFWQARQEGIFWNSLVFPLTVTSIEG